ncbi:GGDEF domain-containing protein [Psychromonas antarctica]|uniref:GGDEF domain-containing protein n=1 Tax=Psychromonas antarctica TaxID=67573 RepID=UPI001EE9066E|nr:GGDEF domain-containing protein [Psychromonas antarctica]MCG6200825.1 diguanylate cyclase [Psychromonas antarctica]
MNSIENMASILNALPDPAFLLSRRGKYLAVYGGSDSRYYHDGSKLVGLLISDLITAEKANWFLDKIAQALASKKLLIEEYELSNKDVKGLSDMGPDEPIWFEGRVQALDFLVNNEEVVLWVASNITARHQFEIKLRMLSDTDQLTALSNRRRLEHDLTLYYESVVRHSLPTSVLIFDLDNLKRINDTLGHHVGDKAILAVANICRSQLRETDRAYRLGGDEFIITLQNSDLDHAMQFAERLRGIFKLQLERFSIAGEAATVSIGVTVILSNDRCYEDSLKRADSALYKAKRSGKDKVACA